jgi:branched-chain amino acid transport system substrate-binding protein
VERQPLAELSCRRERPGSGDAASGLSDRKVGNKKTGAEKAPRREDHMQRLWLVALAALSVAATEPAKAQVSDNVVKIGVLTDMSGPSSAADGPGSVAAAQMAVDDFGGTVLGKPIQIISADHQIKPDIAAGIARQWYDRDQVDLIVDVPVSAVGLAVQNVANERKRLLIVHSTGTADFHGKFCSPYTMQWVFDTHALAVGTAQEVVKRGGDTWFFLTADYAFGHSLERDATQVIVQNGGKVLGSVAHPFSTPDLSSFILQAQSSKAKIIGLASGPPDNVNAIKLGGEFGVFQGGQQMAGLLVLITDVNALGLKAAQGLLLTTSFYWDTDDKTREWSKRFFAKINRMPTMWQAGVYSSVMHYLKAIQAAGTDEPLKVAAKMRDMPVEDFFAHNGHLREDGLMVHDLMLVQVKKPEDSKYPWDYYQILTRIPGEQAFGPPNPACPLVKG